MTTTSPRKQPVIRDVARLAGVSVPTVSRVLTGAARVSEDKRARVLVAIEQLRFRPSAAARALASRQPQLVAVLAGNTSRYGYAETIRGIEECARTAGFTITITVVESGQEDVVDQAVASVTSQPIAGIIVLKFDEPGIAALRRIPSGIPTVAISGGRETRVPQALIDDAAATRELVNHLLDLGHRTVYHVRKPVARPHEGRTIGWRQALTERGATVPPMLRASWEPESGRQIGLRLGDRPDITAVFCGNDEIAMGLIRGIQETGRRVPEDVSVVGFDDHPLAAFWSPPLTTVNQDFAGVGALGWELLDGLLSGAAAPRISVTRPTLVIRESTAPPAR